MTEQPNSSDRDFATEIAQLQERLHEAESRLAAILHAEPECVKVISRAGVFQEINAAGLEILQARSLAEVQARPLMDFVAPEYREAVAELLQKVFAGADAILQFDVIGLQGRRRWLELHATPLRNAEGEVTALLGVTRDLHERRRVEHDRNQLFNLSLDLLCVAGFDGVLKQVNPAWTKCLGWSAEELTSRPMLDFILSEDHEATRRVRAEIHSGKPVLGFENRYRCKDGSFRWLSWNVHPVPELGQVFSVARDVTRQKITEAVLLENERKQRLLAEELEVERARLIAAQRVAKIGSWETNLPSLAVLWSEETHRIFETDPAVFTPTHQGFLELVHPEDRVRVDEAFQQSLTRTEPCMIAHRLLFPDGRIKYVEERWQVVHDKFKQPFLAIGTCQDVTERHCAEAEIERQASFARYNPNPVLELSPEGTINYANEATMALVRALGFEDPAHMLPQGTPEIVRECLVTARPRLRLEIESAGRIISWSFFPIKQNQVVHCYAGDVTERRQAERALQASEEQFSSAFEFAAIGIALVSPQGRFLRVNRALCQMVGYPEAELLALTFQDITMPDDLATDLENLRQLLAGEITSYQMEKRYFHKQGQIIWVLLSVSLVRDEAGQPVHFISQIQDITVGKQATLEAQRVSKLLKAVADGTPDAVFVKDLQGRYLLFNEAASNFVGKPVEEVIGKDDTAIFSPEDARMVMDNDRKVMESDRVQTTEEVLTAAGATRIYQAIKAPYRDAAGEVIGLIGISRDITQRKQAEHRAEEMQLFNQKLLDNSPLAIITYRASGEVVSANEVSIDMLRAPDIKAVMSQNFRHIPFWQETGLLTVAETALAIGQPGEVEVRGINSFGREMWLNCQLVPFTFIHEQYLLCFFDDIHERKQAEALMQEQAALLDIAHEAILVKDMEGRILYWNKGAERIYGWTAGEVFGRVAAEFMYKDADTFQTAFTELLERGEWQGEFVKFTKSGREIIVEVRWTLVLDQEGQPKSILAIHMDVTDKKKLESQFLRAQRMESIGTLAGGIAHDLNNVLAPILMSIEVLRETVENDEALDVLDTLRTSAQRGADLVKQVLTFARGVEGKRVTVNISHILRDIRQVARETFPKNIEATFQLPNDLWPVVGDPTQLHQVFMNLCVNARDAMPEGGKLVVSAQNIVLDEVYAGMYPESRPGNYVVVEVEDTGTGIPSAVRDRIFEPFFTTKEIGKGTGLGLSTSMAIIRSHSGFINVYSELAKGTKFKVYLPARTTPQAADVVAVEQSRLPLGKGELVLVVDDEEAIRGVARKILERFGYQVMLATNGAEAVSLYAQYREGIAVVITDMAMPVMDGPATIIALKAIDPNVKIIGSSGHASNGGVAKALGAGVNIFIPKPYTAETLLTTLADVINGKN